MSAKIGKSVHQNYTYPYLSLHLPKGVGTAGLVRTLAAHYVQILDQAFAIVCLTEGFLYYACYTQCTLMQRLVLTLNRTHPDVTFGPMEV